MFGVRKRRKNNIRLCSTKNIQGFCDAFAIIIVFLIVPVVIFFILAYVNLETSFEYKNALLLSIEIMLLILMVRLACNMYTLVYVVTMDKYTQTDPSITEAFVQTVEDYDEIIGYAPEDLLLPELTIKDVRDYDIPQIKQKGTFPSKLTIENIEKHNAMQMKNSSPTISENSKFRGPKSTSSISTGTTKSVTWADEKSRDGNTVAALVQVHTISSHISSSLDTGLIEAMPLNK